MRRDSAIKVSKTLRGEYETAVRRRDGFDESPGRVPGRLKNVAAAGTCGLQDADEKGSPVAESSLDGVWGACVAPLRNFAKCKFSEVAEDRKGIRRRMFKNYGLSLINSPGMTTKTPPSTSLNICGPAPFLPSPRRLPFRAITVAWVALLALSLTLPITGCSSNSGEKKNGGGAGEKAADGKGGKKDGDKKDKNKEFLTPVVAKKMERGPMRVTVTSTANVIPVRSETIQSMESGILVFTKAWQEGDRVASGTLIATLDNDDLRKQFETSKADLEIQKQNLEIQQIRQRNAEREYLIIQDLYSRGLAPSKDVESGKLQLANARNSLSQARINLEKAELSLSGLRDRFGFLEIRAPFSGLLVSRSTIQGKTAMAKSFGSEPLRALEARYVNKSTDLLGIMDVTQVYLKCDITSKDIAKIRVGQPAEGIVYGRDNIEVRGDVVSVSSNVSPDTRAFEVYVLVSNEEGRLLPGMFGRLEIVVQQLEDVIAIPKAIIQTRGEEDVVFLVDRPSSLPYPVAKQAKVELGVQSRDEVEVTNGIQKGDEVVIRGFEILRDQIPLQVSDADKPTT